MAGSLQDSLTSLAQSFVASVAPGANASEFTASLTSPSLGRGGLQVSDIETTTQLVESAINLGWLTKNVRFTVPDIADQTLLGGMPITGLLGPGVSAITEGGIAPPGVPGLLGALQGTVQIPMDVTQTTLLDVAIDARWTITDDQGDVISDQDLSWQVVDGSNNVLQQGTSGDVALLSGLALDALKLTFALTFVEALSFDGTAFPALIAKRSITASVQLRAGTASSGWIDVPSVGVPLPVVPVPTILLLFENASFTSPGSGFVMVPANSPLDATTVVAAIGALSSTLSPLVSTLSLLSFVAGEIAPGGSVLSALSSAAGATLKFLKADSITDLSNIVWHSHWYGDETVEDEVSSLIMIGVAGRQIQCMNGRNLSGSAEGQLNANVGSELIVEIPNLSGGNPACQPPGRTSVPFPPTGWRWAHSITSFNDEFSSLEFAWQS